MTLIAHGASTIMICATRPIRRHATRLNQDASSDRLLQLSTGCSQILIFANPIGSFDIFLGELVLHIPTPAQSLPIEASRRDFGCVASLFHSAMSCQSKMSWPLHIEQPNVQG